MLRITTSLITLAMLAVGLVHADDDKNNHKRADRLLKLEMRAKKVSGPVNTEEPSSFLVQETQRLIERSRALLRSSYEFDRMLEAVDDLLDARDDLAAAGRGGRDSENNEDTRLKTARRLERAYFRVQQAEYFGRMSGDKRAAEYVIAARQLYQKGRAAYDKREFHRANKLASASSELVNVLENLAQAAVRKPEPPVLK